MALKHFRPIAMVVALVSSSGACAQSASSNLSTTAAGQPVVKAQTASYPSVPAEEEQAARRVAQALINDKQILDVVAQSVDVRLQQDSKMKDLISANPGITSHVAEYVRTHVGAVLTAELPSLREEVSRYFASKMTLAQLIATADTFESPTGRKLLQLGMDSAVNNPDLEVDDIPSADVMRSIDSKDIPIMLKFDKSGAAKVFETNGSEFQGMTDRWFEQMGGKYGERFEEIGAEAIVDYFHKNDPKKSNSAATTSGEG